MQTIRHNVFETNSSSTHSISIASGTKGVYSTIVPNKHGTIKLEGGEFGWTYEKFNDPLTKANYAAQDSKGNQTNLDMLTELLIEHTGAMKVLFDLENGYVDHQSVGTSSDAFSSKQTLKNFIFSPDSWLFNGNDNQSPPPNFHDVDFGISYEYELFIDSCSTSEKFEEKPNDKNIENSIISLLQNYSKFKISSWDGDDWRFFYNESPYKDQDGHALKSVDIENNRVKLYQTTADNYNAKTCYVNKIKNLKFNLKKL